MNLKPAYVLSGQQPALGVVRALGVMGVPIVVLHYKDEDVAYLSKYVTHSVASPHPETHEKEFIELLLKSAAQFGDGILYPASDETLVAVVKNKEILEKHFNVPSPDWDVVQKFIEKKYTYAIADENGIPAPKTITPSCLEDVLRYAEQVDFPCLVKPSQSHLFFDHFKRKMFAVENKDELISIYNQSVDAGLEVMLQEIIPGDDLNVVNYNAYFWEGKPLVEFTAQHIRNAPPWWGSPRVVLSKDIPEVIEPGRKILHAMGFNGYACTEFKKDERNGIYKLIEVNGRHNLSTSLAVECGINFPYLQYRHILENERPSQSSYKEGVYWLEIISDITNSIKFFRQEKYTLSQYLRPYVKPNVFATFALSDLRPYPKRMFIPIKKGFHALSKKLFGGK
ncbi:Predicted ATP-dependent carboligase, ATP-grasp superfamily [Pricia antarctica]|uniref:Predicted ATP-dependent carboligase, ATP-grasp superfamily n=1 Tax=Pricia antarctica TaxID=641691 RepID=A0A1G6YZ55_9FLAO|nr:ATP-grasp domain-containing protein [Pricia antarctica]SDD95628.1 Predicted ATP-dependent carboligase, ATP-grasp superfamily [Pricia antarctica]